LINISSNASSISSIIIFSILSILISFHYSSVLINDSDAIASILIIII